MSIAIQEYCFWSAVHDENSSEVVACQRTTRHSAEQAQWSQLLKFRSPESGRVDIQPSLGGDGMFGRRQLSTRLSLLSYIVHLSVTSTQFRAGLKQLCEADGLLVCCLHVRTSVTYEACKEARWLKGLEHEFTDRKVCGSNPTSASQLPLSRLGQPGSIPALVQPSGGMAVRHRKGATAERFSCVPGGFPLISKFVCSHCGFKEYGIRTESFIDKYTHLQITLGFTADSSESLVYDVLQLNVLQTGRHSFVQLGSK
ncbi:hypothetical protein T265_01933 [Opisthorchis viverrini]|uniref:Uncharacterized protein n=1 Tax=Opisthorchis viverrini TaxID=6198 RepID=A0A074ZXL3_OPIVI|nr:hypothetical protein T265_01933 [Opisthorchis viverrini]KER31841.1 hypothetical protein T265_01933 [Opisthorchis viverrini]